FATNTLHWADAIRAHGVVRAPYPQAHTDAIHEDDIAGVAALALTQDGHTGAAYRLSGPESLTQERQAQHIAEAIGRPLRFEEMTPDEYREQLSLWGQGYIADALLAY